MHQMQIQCTKINYKPNPQNENIKNIIEMVTKCTFCDAECTKMQDLITKFLNWNKNIEAEKNSRKKK